MIWIYCQVIDPTPKAVKSSHGAPDQIFIHQGNQEQFRLNFPLGFDVSSWIIVGWGVRKYSFPELNVCFLIAFAIGTDVCFQLEQMLGT